MRYTIWRALDTDGEPTGAVDFGGEMSSSLEFVGVVDADHSYAAVATAIARWPGEITEPAGDWVAIKCEEISSAPVILPIRGEIASE